MSDTDNEITYSELYSLYVTPHIANDVQWLLRQLSSKPRDITHRDLRHMLDRGTSMFVARDGDKVVGMVLLCPTYLAVKEIKFWIEDVVTDEPYRGRGISSRLMDMAEAAAREMGADSVNLTSAVARGVARDMYAKRGYVLRDTGVFRLTFDAPAN